MRAFSLRLVQFTEYLLTLRARRKAKSRLKQARKHPVRDWVEAFFQAALLVLVINQFFLQAYRIPSGSMIRTFIEGDRIFVNKMLYGPELLPGLQKLPGLVRPQRNDVLIFLNPSYISRGTLFTIAQRTIYMLTLSLVDIDRDAISDEARAQLLIKRAVGVGGDRFRNDLYGNLQVLPPGGDRWVPEEEFQELTGKHYTLQRLLDDSDYEILHEGARALAYRDLNISLSRKESEALARLQHRGIRDPFAFELVRQGTLFSAAPHNTRYRQRYQFIENGWYVPPERIFGLGDNRDNSRDGRYFGPVHEENVLGRSMVIYWPLDRMGRIH
ncbi:signal peptidase I [Alkalispirochaeta americana]|uniref:Signal peptidase I n=1 Tax=Alkalispirochaeta americana TaxID=159291 RepID=A0A1N6P9R0_9SPIO|nr:S26 family signal peptidase [Alkalispirochaeta americana]SIQ01104.1 signal peptidase I [Alkalispirochaeta americana]